MDHDHVIVAVIAAVVALLVREILPWPSRTRARQTEDFLRQIKLLQTLLEKAYKEAALGHDHRITEEAQQRIADQIEKHTGEPA